MLWDASFACGERIRLFVDILAMWRSFNGDGRDVVPPRDNF